MLIRQAEPPFLGLFQQASLRLFSISSASNHSDPTSQTILARMRYLGQQEMDTWEQWSTSGVASVSMCRQRIMTDAMHFPGLALEPIMGWWNILSGMIPKELMKRTWTVGHRCFGLSLQEHPKPCRHCLTRVSYT